MTARAGTAEARQARARQAVASQAVASQAGASQAEGRSAEGLRAQRVRANRWRAVRVAAAPAVLVGALGFLVVWAASSPVAAGVVGVVVAALVGALVRAMGASLTTWIVGASPAGPERQPRVHNLLDRLCPSAGVARPEVWVLDSETPNAMLVATAERRARLVVTAGLVSRLSRVELEAVLAHELMHLRSGDAIPSTVAVAAGWPLLAGIACAGRERDADLAAASLTRYPPGLAAALESLDGPGALPVGGLAARLSAHLWLASPGAPLGPRIAELRGL